MSPAARRQRQEAPVTHGAYATVSASRLRQRKLRRKVAMLKRQFPVLANKPDHLIQRYAEIDLIAAKVFAALVDDDVVGDTGEPRRLLNEHRLYLAELRALAASLGMLDDKEPDLFGGIGSA